MHVIFFNDHSFKMYIYVLQVVEKECNQCTQKNVFLLVA